jgi:hypothetical protein
LAGPRGYAAEANELLADLHTLDYYILSFSRTPYFSNSTIESIEKRLANSVSKRYEEALRAKLSMLAFPHSYMFSRLIIARYKSIKSQVFDGSEAAALKTTAAENEARRVIAKAEVVMARSNGPWIYGLHGPTALDAHFVIFLRRMKEVGYSDYFPEIISRYLSYAEGTKEFQDTMRGEDTLPAAIKN